VQALVATDIAARGLDIAQLPQVVNFDLPNVAALLPINGGWTVSH
jgi:ATP-dependent RNA helicase RhlE